MTAPNVTIRIEGVEPLVAKLGRLRAFSALRPTMEQAVALVQREVARYPRPPKAGDFPGFKSSKQRRWFFWAMQNGKITVPYRRTGTLGKSWTTEVHSLASDLQGIVGNVRPYAPYVQDDERQAAIHKGRWGTVQDAVRRKANEVINLFKQEIARIING